MNTGSKIINKLHLSSIHNDDQDYLNQSNDDLHSSESSTVVIITNATTSTNKYDIHDFIGITAKYVVSISSVVS